MIQDKSVNNAWKNLVGDLYDTLPSWQIMGGFINDIHSSFETLESRKIQNAIDIQQKIMEQLLLHRDVVQPI